VPARFDKLGISFQYPDNWTLDDADALAGRRSVTVCSPGGAFWCVAMHPRSVDPVGLARSVVDAMREEYAEVEAEEICETLAGCEMIGYDLNFYCLDLTNSAQVRSLRIGQTTYSIFCQAEDREFAWVRRVFQAITCSLLGGL